MANGTNIIARNIPFPENESRLLHGSSVQPDLVTDRVVTEADEWAAPLDLSQSLELQRTEAVVVVILLCCVGAAALLLNLLVFFATRFVVHERNSTVVVIANTCMADAMAGTFAVSKTTFLYVSPVWVNCFLWESMLFTSLIMSSVLTPCFMWDCLQRLHRTPYSGLANKRKMIVSMVFLWDGAVIVGFIPLMGWNRWEELDRQMRTCHFFLYYQTDYLTVVCSLLLSGLIFSVGLLGVLFMRKRKFSASLSNTASFAETAQFEHFEHSVTTCAHTCCFQILSFLPFILFVLVKCRTNTVSNDVVLMYVIVALLTKSVVSPIILGRRTHQVAAVLKGALNMQLQSSFLCCVLDESVEQHGQQSHISVIENTASNQLTLHTDRHTAHRIDGRFHTIPIASRGAHHRPSASSACQAGRACQSMCTKCGYINLAFSSHSLTSLPAAAASHTSAHTTAHTTAHTESNSALTMHSQAQNSNSKATLSQKTDLPLVINPQCQVHGKLAKPKAVAIS